jgi:hypothetical protein
MNRGFAWGAALGLLAGVGGTLLWPRGDTEHEATAGSRPGAGSPSAPAPTSAPRLEGSPTSTAGIERQLKAANARIAELTRDLDAAKRPATATAAPVSPWSKDELPAVAREHAARLKVSDRVLDLMWTARNNYYGADAAKQEELVAPLRAFGDEALLSAVALQRGGGGHIDVPMIVAALRLPRGADSILRLLDEEPNATSLARALPAYDSPRVRTYLLDRIARETEVVAYWNLAAALGDLKEPRGPEVMRVQQFLGPTWSGVRGYILYDVGRMGGPAAVRLLEEYLQMASADHLGSALAALATLDRERARGHARRIKESDRYGFLDVMDRVGVDRLAADDAAPEGTRKVSAR